MWMSLKKILTALGWPDLSFCFGLGYSKHILLECNSSCLRLRMQLKIKVCALYLLISDFTKNVSHFIFHLSVHSDLYFTSERRFIRGCQVGSHSAFFPSIFFNLYLSSSCHSGWGVQPRLWLYKCGHWLSFPVNTQGLRSNSVSSSSSKTSHQLPAILEDFQWKESAYQSFYHMTK